MLKFQNCAPLFCLDSLPFVDQYFIHTIPEVGRQEHKIRDTEGAAQDSQEKNKVFFSVYIILKERERDLELENFNKDNVGLYS